MREIKFRGKKTNGEWIFGSLIKYDFKFQIGVLTYADKMTFVNVKEHTTGQFIGIKDKNGKEIYEGDYLRFVDISNQDDFLGVVIFDSCSFCVKGETMSHYRWMYYSELEVLGNIHDNPEWFDGAFLK